MKRKMYVTLMSFALIASMVCGCGNKTNQSAAAERNSTAAEPVEITDENAIKETETTTEAEDNKESETVSETTPAPAPAQSSEVILDKQESGEETENSKEPEEGSAVSKDQTMAATPAPAETLAQETETPDAAVPAGQAAYTVTEMTATMYAKNAVNLRQGPGTEYAKVGNLTRGQQVKVTGQAANGWYQLDSGVFVSNKYLADTDPVQQAAITVPDASTDSTGTIIPVGTETEPFGGTSIEFINYLNQQRTAAGLSALVWDDNLAAVAQRRAQELTVDNSHNGCPADCSEIIYMGGSSYTDWYNAWYNSQAHRENMFRDDHGTAACAYYYQNYNYYVVTLFKQREKTQEELDSIMNPDNMVQIGGNAYIDKDAYEALINAGIDPSAETDDEINKKIEEQQKLLDQGIIDRVIE